MSCLRRCQDMAPRKGLFTSQSSQASFPGLQQPVSVPVVISQPVVSSGYNITTARRPLLTTTTPFLYTHLFYYSSMPSLLPVLSDPLLSIPTPSPRLLAHSGPLPHPRLLRCTLAHSRLHPRLRRGPTPPFPSLSRFPSAFLLP